MKRLCSSFLLLLSLTATAQNIVPNPGFEGMVNNCTSTIPTLDCLDSWKDFSGSANPAFNTPDLCYNTAVFFPPSSIPAYEGTQYIGLDCQVINPEFVQIRLTEPMTAGTTYCVSFHISAYQTDWPMNLSPIGAYFSAAPLTANPFLTGLQAHVESTITADPTAWQLVTGTYTATGGEEYITLGCFQITSTTFSYMYIDAVQVVPFQGEVDLGADQTICPGTEITLDAGADGTAWLWSTGETTASITVTQPGIYSVQKFYGACSITDEVILSADDCDTPPVITEPGTLYIPNAFTPNGDGLNDSFGAAGQHITGYRLTIFNRWGEEIFSSADMLNTWDGTYHHAPVPTGLYVYTLHYISNNKEVEARGKVMVVR